MGSRRLKIEPWRFGMEPWRVSRPSGRKLAALDEEQYPDSRNYRYHIIKFSYRYDTCVPLKKSITEQHVFHPQ
jgi:hypothetical protein